jgi:hypothetical protein
VRQKAVGTECPEMRVEKAATLFVDGLHGDPPIALEAPFEERRQRVLDLGFRQMVEQDFH